MLFITVTTIGLMCSVGGFLVGYEKRSKEEEQEVDFWVRVEKELKKNGL